MKTLRTGLLLIAILFITGCTSFARTEGTDPAPEVSNTEDRTDESHEVTILDHEGQILSERTVSEGEDVTYDAPEREGYDFKGWSEDLTDIREDQSVEPVYEPKMFNVEFLDHDGSLIDTRETKYMDTADAPEDPERRGYSFTGWSGSLESVTDDRTVEAEYEIEHYTVEFKTDDYSLIEMRTVEYYEKTTLPEGPEKEGYRFDGWSSVRPSYRNTAAYSEGDEVPIFRDRVYYTVYTPNEEIEHTVIFHDYDGTVLKEETLHHMESATPPDNMDIAHHNFRGWSEDTTEVKDDLEVHPEYRELSTIDDYTFNKDTGTITGFVHESSQGTILEDESVPTMIDGVKVKAIGEDVFKESLLATVKLPEGIEVIGRNAFRDSTVNTINLPSSLTKIEAYAFIGTDRLKNIEIPESVESIGKSAFYRSGLETLDIGMGVKEIGSWAFADTAIRYVTIPGSVKTVGTYAFHESEVEGVTIKKGVEAIEKKAFEGNSIANVYIPYTVETIGESAFAENPVRYLTVIGGHDRFDKSWSAMGLPEPD